MSDKLDIRNMKRPSSVKKNGTEVAPIIPPTKKDASGQVATSDIGKVAPLDSTVGDIELEEYKTFLKANKISDSDIFAVLDGLITEGDIYWTFDLLGKIPVTLKTRPTWVNMELLTELEAQSPKTYMRFTNIVNLFNLAGSLFSYKGEQFALTSKDDLYKAYSFVNALPHVLQAKLIEKLAIFDRLVTVAASDWAIENFTQPQEEK